MQTTMTGLSAMFCSDKSLLFVEFAGELQRESTPQDRVNEGVSANICLPLGSIVHISPRQLSLPGGPPATSFSRGRPPTPTSAPCLRRFSAPLAFHWRFRGVSTSCQSKAAKTLIRANAPLVRSTKD